FYGYDGKKLSTLRKEFAQKPQSHYGYTWRERHGILLGILNIHAGEILVKELRTDETLALRRGFLRVRPQQLCPAQKDDRMTSMFVENVLRPKAKLGS